MTSPFNCKELFDNKVVFITGGTGSFGHHVVSRIFAEAEPKRVIIYSRDEFKQSQMKKRFSPAKMPIRYVVGDVRDVDRLIQVMSGVDVVFHAAALKQVPAMESNPTEALATNVGGAQNVIRACKYHNVPKTVALSTDKAANPINLYGATKLCSDKLFVASNHSTDMEGNNCKFAVVRYGNVFGSRGSVVPFFLSRKESGVLPITDAEMTRFTLSLDEAVNFTFRSLALMNGGEIYVPKIPSYVIGDLAKAIAPDAETPVIGIRPGEKVHEVMVPADESWKTVEFPTYYVILPFWIDELEGGTKCKPNFCYSSGNNTMLSVEQLRTNVEEYLKDHDDLTLVT